MRRHFASHQQCANWTSPKTFCYHLRQLRLTTFALLLLPLSHRFSEQDALCISRDKYLTMSEKILKLSQRIYKKLNFISKLIFLSLTLCIFQRNHHLNSQVVHICIEDLKIFSFYKITKVWQSWVLGIFIFLLIICFWVVSEQNWINVLKIDFIRRPFM